MSIINTSHCHGFGVNEICTGAYLQDLEGKKSGACVGDSGGPLSVHISKDVYEVWGATSKGDDTCDPTSGVSSGVWAMAWGDNPQHGSVRNWIDSVTGGECPRQTETNGNVNFPEIVEGMNEENILKVF